MKNMLKRTIKTFIQAAVAYIVTTVSAQSLGDFNFNDKTVVYGLLISCVAAGLAAVMNMPNDKEAN